MGWEARAAAHAMKAEKARCDGLFLLILIDID
jgi:hypothetical protein